MQQMSEGSTMRPRFKQEHDLNENVIQIELDIEPSMFSEYLKERFLNQFQDMLTRHREQFRLKKPRVVLVNTRIVAPPNYSKKSSVVLELIVTDLIYESIRLKLFKY
jgi:hypothetical protein